MSLVQITNVKGNTRVPLDQLQQSPEFGQWLNGKPESAGDQEELDPNSRRDILKIMAAGAGLAGLVSCRRPEQKIVSFSKGVEDLIPGKPLYYNTVYNLAGVGQGLRIEANDGRPTKAEGNPAHPSSRGAANTYGQGSILNLYDPDRCSYVMKDGAASTWEAFNQFAAAAFPATADGTGLALVVERNAGPAWRAAIDAAKRKWPKALWVEFEPVNHDNAVLGTQIATGTKAMPHYAYDKADVVLSLDCDFLGVDAASVEPTRLFSQKRQIKSGVAMNRLYSVEGHFSLTGGMADHRLRLKPSEVAEFASEILAAISSGSVPSKGTEGRKKFAAAVAADLKSAAGKSIVCAGPRQSPQTHAIALAINQALSNVGPTVHFYPTPFEPQADGLAVLKPALTGGQIQTLVILGGNPAFTMPADFAFAENAKKAKTVIHLGLDHDETAAIANWCLPMASFLEAWGDARSEDGTVSIQQPVIAPLYGGKTSLEVLSMLAGLSVPGVTAINSYELTKAHWTGATALPTNALPTNALPTNALPTNALPGNAAAGDKQKLWRKYLHDGIVEGSAYAPLNLTTDVARVAALPVASPSNGLELAFLPGAGVFDGRFANNAFLIELPDPVTKVVWDNCVTMSRATAKQIGAGMGFIGDPGDMVTLTVGSATLTVPICIVPGHADGVLSINLGYGRQKVGRVGKGAGFNAYTLRASSGLGFATGVTAAKATGNYLLVRTQDDPEGDTQHNRPIAQQATLKQFEEKPAFSQHTHGPIVESLFPDWGYTNGNQWGMTIDLNQCTGCNACLVACFTENNIPMVGKEMVNRGREMHWIRLDRYYTDTGDDAQFIVQPLNCQQCENAPCESVCPVAATVHSPEGLNDMAYNRCIGTRYCMNNCPYKVRKFNYLNWNKNKTEVENLGSNPDVSVRMRGVMEKCTYCVQRVAEGKINAKIDPAGRRAIRDGEIQTACQQTCPADAIVFGNINDPNSKVAKLKTSPRNYALLSELNVRPRTTYLSRIRNTNTALVPHVPLEGAAHGGGHLAAPAHDEVAPGQKAGGKDSHDAAPKH